MYSAVVRFLLLLLAFMMLQAIQAAFVSPALAQDDSGAAAEVLFREGKALFDAGRFAEACPKFAESYRLDSGLGTLGNLALCYEKLGKTASAWARWVDLAALAGRAGQADRTRIAKEHIAELEPKLVKLIIDVPRDHHVVGLEVRRDQTVVAEVSLGSAVAVDPGMHRVTASAPEHEPWTTEVEVRDPRAPVRVVVPKLDKIETMVTPLPVEPVAPPPVEPLTPQPEPDPAPTPHPLPDDDPSLALPITGGIVALVGVVALAVGGGLAASAASDWSAADCDKGVCPTAERQMLAEDANMSADLATGFVIAGSVLAAGGAALIIVGVLEL